ncbi:MAG: penicillin-binding protein, partial [Microlunatus sp.]|nr:penicillin-binding protein [Microlunatus sp.]
MAEPRNGHSAEQRSTGKAAARPGESGPKATKISWPKRIALALVVVVLAGVIGVAALAVYGYATTQRPNANADFQTATTFVYYDNGKSKLGSFAVQNRQPLTFEEIPDTVKQAAVSAENRDFWTDRGVSIRGMFRAAWVILRGGDVQGGSTITQQYIKIMYLNSEQTVSRKFRELFLASKINSQLSKEQILTDYLNTIYFGRGAYGIQAASKAYFDIDAKELDVQQAAVLISVINNPSQLDPGVDEANIPRLTERYTYVLTSMAETGAITQAEAATYAAELPEFPEVKINERYGGPKGFLLKMVETELTNAGFEPSQISGGGLKITTTFDKSAQNAAVEAAQTNTKQAADARGQKASKLHAAVASVEVGTGEVLALYGGPDYVKNSRNWATTARPTASTFKTYALAAGLEDGFSLNSRFNGNTFTPPGDSTPVRNEFSYQYGSGVTLLKAATDSINTAFVDMTTQMDNGPQLVADTAEAVGAPKGAGWDLNSRIALGTAEVSPLDQANAYATFANDGTRVAPHVVKEVADANGTVIYRASAEEKKAVAKDVSRDVNFALSNVVEQGTGGTVRTLNRPVAGKTGTKDVDDDITSAWFVAYTPQISTAVMYVAGDDCNADLDPYARPGDNTFFGSTYPALTWVDYMQTAVKDLPVEQFEEPAYVNRDSGPPPNQTYAPQPQPTQTREPARAPSAKPTTKKPTTEKPTTENPTAEPTTEKPTTEPTTQ